MGLTEATPYLNQSQTQGFFKYIFVILPFF